MSKAESKKRFTALIVVFVFFGIFSCLPFASADEMYFYYNAYDESVGAAVSGVNFYVNGTYVGTTSASGTHVYQFPSYYDPTYTVVLTADFKNTYGNYLRGFKVNGVLYEGNSSTFTINYLNEKTVQAWYEKQWWHDPAVNNNYTFTGMIDEVTGQYVSKVNVTAHYLNRTDEVFTVDGSYTYQSSAVPLYFSYALPDNVTREYWLQPGETSGNYGIYSNAAGLTPIVFQIRALGGVGLSSYLDVQRIINGTYQTVEKRQVDANGIATMSLQPYTVYRLIAVSHNSSYTFGNINTYTTAITLTLSALSFPNDVLMQYKYLRIWASRPSSTEIQICYEDTNLQTESVSYQIAYANGTVAYSAIHTGENSFIDVWLEADSNTTYYLTANVSQSTFGYSTFAQVLLRDGASTSPIDLSFLGDWPIDPTQIFWAFIVFIIFGVGSVLNAYIGGFAGVATAAILVWLGWLVLPLGAIVAAFCVVCMVGIVYWKRRS